MIELIVTLFTLAAALISWRLFHSILLSVLITLAAILIMRTVKPYLQRPWYKKHPPVKVDVLKEEHIENPASMGVHFLIMTQEIYFYANTKADSDYLLELADECIEKLLEDEAFKYRYNYVLAKRYPIQISYCGCGRTDMSVSTHYMKWIKSFGLVNMEGYKENREMFTIDDTIKHPSDGSVHRIMFQALFDPKLPVMPEK